MKYLEKRSSFERLNVSIRVTFSSKFPITINCLDSWWQNYEHPILLNNIELISAFINSSKNMYLEDITTLDV